MIAVLQTTMDKPIFRFAIVGTFTFVLPLAIAAVLREIVMLGDQLAFFISAIIAVETNFFLSYLFTWKLRWNLKDIAGSFVRFHTAKIFYHLSRPRDLLAVQPGGWILCRLHGRCGCHDSDELLSAKKFYFQTPHRSQQGTAMMRRRAFCLGTLAAINTYPRLLIAEPAYIRFHETEYLLEAADPSRVKRTNVDGRDTLSFTLRRGDCQRRTEFDECAENRERTEISDLSQMIEVQPGENREGAIRL